MKSFALNLLAFALTSFLSFPTLNAQIIEMDRGNTINIPGTNPTVLELNCKEDCVEFDPHGLDLCPNGRQTIVCDGNHALFAFDDKEEALRVLRLLQRLEVNQSCFVGRPNPSLSYVLSNGRKPTVRTDGEECDRFDPNGLKVQFIGEPKNYTLTDGNMRIGLYDTEEEARQALCIILKHGFSQYCYEGSTFQYLK